MSPSDFLTPEDRAGVPWAGCLRCRFRGHCTHFQTAIQEESLLRAARQSRTATRQLHEATERLTRSIEQAETVDTLLRAGEELEDSLNQILQAEAALRGEVPAF